MKTAKRLRRAQERPTWLPVHHRIGEALYHVYPSGTVYRAVGRTLVKVDAVSAALVLARVYEAQQAARTPQAAEPAPETAPRREEPAPCTQPAMRLSRSATNRPVTAGRFATWWWSATRRLTAFSTRPAGWTRN